jgi:predicted nucleic acid-binding protein
MKVLVDTNVVMDVLLRRSPFYQDSFTIFQLVDLERINGCLSASSITDVFYLLSKDRHNSGEVYRIMDELIDLFSVIPVSETTISAALALRWKDFEDAVQYITAKENDITHIITRNKKDYENTDINCFSPAEFIIYSKETN